MIYQPKPQRGGKSIITNTNNPPQDPPPPPIIPSEKTVEFSVSSASPEPPTPEPIKVTKKVTKTIPVKTIPVKIPKKKLTVTDTPKIVKLTILQKISKFFKKIFRRDD